ncbi:MAG TPA: hypothetical protein V6D29_01445 [Leptolyngbyaceae cyanobacterium]
MNKLLIGIGMFFGSTLGSYVPAPQSAGTLSLASVFFSVVGGIVGIWLGYRLSKYLGFI